MLTAIDRIKAAYSTLPNTTPVFICIDGEPNLTVTLGDIRAAFPVSVRRVTVTASSGVNIRAEPKADARKMGTLAAGLAVTVSGTEVNGYLKLWGMSGWIIASGIS